MKTIENTHVFHLKQSYLDVIEVHKGLPTELGEIYDSVAAQGVATCFQRRPWLESWQNHIGQGNGTTPIIVIGKRNAAAVVALPLNVEHAGGLRKLTWLGQNLNDYCGPIGEPQALQSLSPQKIHALLTQTAEALGGIDIVQLQKQKRHYGLIANPFVTEDSIKYHVASHRTVLMPSWDDYFNGKRSSKTRSRLRNKLNSLSKIGTVTMQFATDPKDAAGLVSRALEMKANQLRDRNHSNPFARLNAQEHLVSFFAGRCQSDTWVASLSLNDKPLAISFGFGGETSWLLYQIAMESGAYEMYSPGTQLIMFIMKHCCENKVGEFDLSLGDEAYKLEWCETSETLYDTIIPLTLRGNIAAMAMRLGAHGRGYVSSNPALYDTAKMVKLKFDSLFRNGQHS
jgi:CelD/BcsL family acetyltransferase involved in cellulose biosynthesis